MSAWAGMVPSAVTAAAATRVATADFLKVRANFDMVTAPGVLRRVERGGTAAGWGGYCEVRGAGRGRGPVVVRRAGGARYRYQPVPIWARSAKPPLPLPG